MFYIVQQDIIILAFYLKLNIYIYIRNNHTPRRGKWVFTQRYMVGLSAQCDRCGVSGFVGNLVWAGLRTMARRSRRWCDDLSTLSSFFLCLSLCALSGNGEMISMIGDWVRRGWVWTIGVVRSSCSDAIWLYSCSDKAIFLLSLSLSLFYFPRPEIVWSENENGNHFPPFWLYFTVNPEMVFSLIQFEVTTKHPLFWKIISGISLKPKQTEP